jgi:hypothetical protein
MPQVCAVGLERSDYETLLQAVKDIDVHLVIAAASPGPNARNAGPFRVTSQCGGLPNTSHNNYTPTVLDGKAAWGDNVFVECLWRSVKSEVNLRAYESVSEARASIGRYLNFYNGRRPH